MNPLLLLSIALALSLSGNAGLTYVYLGARDDLATSNSDRDHAEGAARTCDNSIGKLQKAAEDRALAAYRTRLDATALAKNKYELAAEIMAAPASDPNDCIAARQRRNKWLQSRTSK